MTDQDKKPFALLMGELGAAFRTEVQKETMAVYFNHLADYQLDAAAHAIREAINSGERFPVIKTLREFANAYRPRSNRLPVTDAVQIAEFTETEIEASKQKLSEMVNSLADSMG